MGKEINEVKRKLEHWVATKWVIFFLTLLFWYISYGSLAMEGKYMNFRNKEVYGNLLIISEP